MHHLESDGAPKERADGEKIAQSKVDDVVKGVAAGGDGDADVDSEDGDERDEAEEAVDEGAEDEDEGERELEEGEEYCPICERRNHPGACDVCEHYFGNCWDGMIMWSLPVCESMESAWSELGELIHHEFLSVHRDPLLFCKAVALQEQLSAEFLDEELLELSASSALERLVEFAPGDSYETDGMLSGSGYSLYLESTQPVDELVARIQALVAAVRKAMQ